MAAWIAPSAVNLIGQLPTRACARPYPSRSLRGITDLATHYLGDPVLNGSVLGFGDISALNTAIYQTGRKDGDQFPAIAYHFVINRDGTLSQCHDIATRTWHVGTPGNDHAIGVLLTGFGRLGGPSAEQIVSLRGLWQALCLHLDRPVRLRGHRDISPSQCPGDLWREWLDEARRIEGVDKDQLREHLNVLWGYAAKADQAGQDAAKAAVYLAAVASDCQETARAVRERVLAVKEAVGLE